MKPELEALILKLLNEKKTVNLNEIAERANLSAKSGTDRRAIQRALAKMIRQNLVEATGKARARVYTLKESSSKTIEAPALITSVDSFKDIHLSAQSAELLQYISKSVQERKPVAYFRNFLFSYEPNKTFYLNPSLQKELLSIGQAENAVRPAGTYARNILTRLLIDLSWNSSRLEGNTYSLLETKRLLDFGENAEGKDAVEAQMILNHKDAIEYIIESADEKNISAHEILSIHALLSNNLLGDPSASGRVREMIVGISGTTYLPLENPHVLKECFNIFIEKMNRIENPFEQSFFSLVHLSYLQAFQDVNKRTARLVANIPFIKNNLKPLSFTDVTQKDYVAALIGVYEKNDVSLLRDLYVWAYKRSSQQYSAIQQVMGEPDSFKLKYRGIIQNIIRTIVLEKASGSQLVSKIKNMIQALNISETDATRLFQMIEVEIISLHDGNIARFKIRPSEFQQWKDAQ
jgi:Fic family protein